MELTLYKKYRTAVQSNASPASTPQILEVEDNLRSMLMSNGFFEDVEVDHTDDVDELVIAMCRFPSQMSHVQIAQRLEQAWQDRLRFEFWEAHATLVDNDQVEFQGATRSGTGGTYVTVHIVAQKADVPAQRVGGSW
jgi:hypothetical protein